MKSSLLFILVAVATSGLLCLGCEQTKKPYPVAEYEDYSRTADGKPICPKCRRSDKVVQYRYGKDAKLSPGQVGAGCCVGPDSADFRCDHCSTNFGITDSAYTIGSRQR
jgi:hypothetical protein